MGVQANDLRIGNWVLNGGGIAIQCTSPRICDIDNKIVIAEPIPLTPEILEKCGFIYDGNGHYFKDLITHYLEIIIGNDGFYPFYAVRYVHQLQNLYFALTGEELSINL